MNKRLLLVDTPSYYYRAFHALPELRSSAGEPTGAIYGVLNMLRKLKEDFPSDFLACVLDPKGKTFRDEIYTDYKATRQAMPEDLSLQIGPLLETIAALGWPIVVVDGVEADDVIGTLSKHACDRGYDTIISTGDKDLTQLVNECVTWVNTMSMERLDPQGVEKKFGVPPTRIIDYLALVGDSVDNVPGVDKVGPKTAVKLLAEYGSLEGVIEHAAEVKGVVGENLRRVLDWLPTARTLVTVKCDVTLPFGFDGLAPRPPDEAQLAQLYERFGFRALRDALTTQGGAGDAGAPATRSKPAAKRTERVAEAPPAPAAATAQFIATRRYETILDAESFERWAARLETATLACIDTHTTSADPFSAQLVGLSFAITPGEAAYLPLRHGYLGAPDQLDSAMVLARLTPWLENATRPKVGYHTKFHWHVFANHGIAVRGIMHDTALQSYVLESHQRHDLDSLATRHLGVTPTPYTAIAGKGASERPFEEVEVGPAAAYAAETADVTLQLHGALWPMIEGDPKLARIYTEIEMPAADVLAVVERNGVRIDADLLNTQSHELSQTMRELEGRAYELAGSPFNMGSPKQLGEILFERLQLRVVKKTPSGAPSTDEEVLETLAVEHPICEVLLHHRGLSKLRSTYTEKLPRSVNQKTLRVHTTYAQDVAVTGRLSSTEPNLQNIPIRTAEGRRIREAFVAPPGAKILSADYSQIELRIMAHLSADAGLIDAFAKGEDVHRHTAAEIFELPLDQVSGEQRRYAKVINFGLMYGMSAFGLASNLGIERAAAQGYMEKYFARYPGVARYMQQTRVTAREQGFVETVFGRRLFLPDIRSANQGRRTAAERQAINAPMQGTAADLIKLAMIAVQHWLDEEKVAAKMIMQVHDELVLEVPDAEVERVRPAVERLMTGVATLDVPLVAETGVGQNWDKAH